MTAKNPHREIICIETGETYESIKVAAAAVNRNPSAISQAIANGTKSAGYHWEKTEHIPFSIYKFTFPSGKIYIGETEQIPSIRWANGEGYQKNVAMTQEIHTVGWDNVKKEILERVKTKEEALARERYYILEFNSANPDYGYNINTNIFASGTSEEIRLRKKELSRKWANVTNPHKTVVCVETEIEYISASEAARQLGLNPSHICAVCRGDEGRHTCGGYHWKFGSVID